MPTYKSKSSSDKTGPCSDYVLVIDMLKKKRKFELEVKKEKRLFNRKKKKKKFSRKIKVSTRNFPYFCTVLEPIAIFRIYLLHGSYILLEEVHDIRGDE